MRERFATIFLLIILNAFNIDSSCTDIVKTQSWRLGDHGECIKIIQEVVGGF
jgi:hypothetical protein